MAHRHGPGKRCQNRVSPGREHPQAAGTPRAPWLGWEQAEAHSTPSPKPPGLFVAALAPGTATSALALPPPPSANLEVHRGQCPRDSALRESDRCRTSIGRYPLSRDPVPGSRARPRRDPRRGHSRVITANRNPRATGLAAQRTPEHRQIRGFSSTSHFQAGNAPGRGTRSRPGDF